MRKFLKAGVAAITLTGLGLTAQASAIQTADDDVRIVITGENGSQNIVVRGNTIESRDGEIIVNGQRVEIENGQTVIINGGEVEIVDEPVRSFSFEWRSEDELEGEVHEHVARALAEVENVRVLVERDIESDVRVALADVESEMSVLHLSDPSFSWVIENGERRELSAEEAAEIEAEVSRAREEVRRAMEEVRIELHEGSEERREALRVMRLDLAEARRAAREAREDSHRILVATAHRRAEVEALQEALRENGARRLRFESTDGHERLWVDGEELEGDARTDWLNRLELERLEGGEQEHTSRSIVIEVD